MRLKKTYSSREVAAATGLTARQLQIWDGRGLMRPAFPTHRTQAGGFTERRYTPVELLELLVLAELRGRGFTVHQLHSVVEALKSQFRVSLFEATGGGERVRLMTDGARVFARTASGEFYDLITAPRQPLLVDGDLRRLKVVEGKPKRRKGPRSAIGDCRKPIETSGDRKDPLHVVRRARDDVHADQLSDAPSGCGSSVGRRLYRADIAADDGGDEPGIDFLPADEHDVGRLQHRVGRFDHPDESAASRSCRGRPRPRAFLCQPRNGLSLTFYDLTIGRLDDCRLDD